MSEQKYKSAGISGGKVTVFLLSCKDVGGFGFELLATEILELYNK